MQGPLQKVSVGVSSMAISLQPQFGPPKGGLVGGGECYSFESVKQTGGCCQIGLPCHWFYTTEYKTIPCKKYYYTEELGTYEFSNPITDSVNLE